MENIHGVISILLVEDDDIDAEAIISLFKRLLAPIRFHVAKNGEEALDKLYGRNGSEKINPLPNAIILDTNMPKMNGIEFLENIRPDSTLENIPIFMVTGEYTTREQLTIHHLNVAARMIKPFQFEDVKHIYSIILERQIK
jgi:CheY-like chemotaxis protein